MYFQCFLLFFKGKFYKITNVVVAKYDGKKVLRVSENSKVTEMKDDMNVKTPTAKQLHSCDGVVSMVDPSSLQPRFCCHQCEKEIKSTDENLFFCCGKMVIESEVLKKDQVYFTVRADGEKLQFLCKMEILQDMVGVKTSSDMFLKLFLGRRVNISYKKSSLNEVVTITDNAS